MNRLLIVAAAIIVAAGLYLVLRPGDDDSDATTTPTTTAATTTAGTTTGIVPQPPQPPSAPAAQQIRIVVRGGKPVGGVKNVTVTKGERVVIVITSDVEDELHLHGYNLKRDLTPGVTARLPFRATLNGTVEAELESRGIPLVRITTQQ
jgi:heme/copper-type cytochrome/quinol oxidase subunit 2